MKSLSESLSCVHQSIPLSHPLKFRIFSLKGCIRLRAPSRELVQHVDISAGYVKDTPPDCRTYLANGKLTHANRNDIRTASFHHVSKKHTPSEMFHVFLQIVNGATRYNSNENINAIPIIVYHDITTSLQDYTIPNHAASTTLDLFAQ